MAARSERQRWWWRGRSAQAQQPPPPQRGAWYDELSATARAHGAYPYLVEGFGEIVEAVRRGHAVVVKRVASEVADGIRVFDGEPGGAGPQVSPLARIVGQVGDGVVTILRFNVSTARFELQDVGLAGAGVQLTPKRLQRYLSQPGCETGVALGA